MLTERLLLRTNSVLTLDKPLGSSLLPAYRDPRCSQGAAPWLCSSADPVGSLRSQVVSEGLSEPEQRDVRLGRALGSCSTASHDLLAQHKDANSSCDCLF